MTDPELYRAMMQLVNEKPDQARRLAHITLNRLKQKSKSSLWDRMSSSWDRLLTRMP